MVGDVGLPGNFSFKVTGQWKPITHLQPISKDQVNDARHKANLVGYKGGSRKDTGYFQIIISIYI